MTAPTFTELFGIAVSSQKWPDELKQWAGNDPNKWATLHGLAIAGCKHQIGDTAIVVRELINQIQAGY